MKIAFFDSHQFEKNIFNTFNQTTQFDINYIDARLNIQTVNLAQGAQVICSFVNDKIDSKVLESLQKMGIGLIALRCAGYNHIDIVAARKFGIRVVRVPEYSPHAVAEHTMSLLMTLNRKIHKAYNRVREGNFSLDGLVGFDLFNKKVAVIGTGRIGKVVCQILKGYGCQILAFDLTPDDNWASVNQIKYFTLDECYSNCDILTFHCPLTPDTFHMLNSTSMSKLKQGVVIINTSRGALIDTKALIKGLKSKQIAAAGLDVYEEEAGIFFQDLSSQILGDDVLARLLTFPNVLITSHQAFLTNEALTKIAETTLSNVLLFKEGKELIFEIE